MKILRSVLERYCPEISKIEDEKIYDTLNTLGIEVSSYESTPEIEKLCVAKVVQLDVHPNNPNLTICSLQYDNKRYSVVCGANNVLLNNYVAFAMPGCILPGGKKIKEREIDGVISEGMICSVSEVIEDKDYICEYDEQNIIIRKDGRDFYNTERALKWSGLADTIFEIEIPSNRPDLNSMLVVAKEIYGFLNLSHDSNILLEDDKKTSNRYYSMDSKINYFKTVSVDNVEIEPSPTEIRTALMHLGIKPINNIVDITNYVTYLTGIPTHAYDLDKISGMIRPEIVLDRAYLKTLLDKDITLLDEDIIIVDSENNIVSAAGIVGSHRSSIQENTKKVIFEIASFNPEIIKNTAQRVGIETNASEFFAKGVPSFMCLVAEKEIKSLLSKNIIGHNLTSERVVVDLKENKKKGFANFNWQLVQRIIGNYQDQKRIKEIMTKQGFSMKKAINMNMDFCAPSWRIDVNHPKEFIEEIMKYQDINTIVDKNPSALVYNPADNFIKKYKYIESVFQKAGFNEVKTYSLESSENPVFDSEIYPNKKIEISNSVSINRQFLKTSNLNQLLEVAKKNYSRKNYQLGIYSISKLTHNLDNYKNVVSAICYGDLKLKSWDKFYTTYDFFLLKGIVQEISRYLDKEVTFDIDDFVNFDFVHKKSYVKVFYNKKKIGNIFTLSPEMCLKYNLPKNTAFMELFLDEIERNKNLYTPVKKYPKATKDFSIEINSLRIYEKEVKRRVLEIQYVKDIEVIDYIKNDNNSWLTFRIVLQHNNGTISKDQINVVESKVKKILEVNNIIIR
jgi:phenylalanyl-tRNA synthetase beta chain